MVMWYWSVAILFWQLSILSIDHIVKVQYKRFGFAKTRLRHPSLPFLSLPYPTRTTCRRVRSINHVTTKRKEVNHILWVWGSHARLSRVGAPLIIIILIKQNFIHRFKKKIDYLQIQKYEILKYIPYVHFSCLRKRIVVKWLSKDY